MTPLSTVVRSKAVRYTVPTVTPLLLASPLSLSPLLPAPRGGTALSWWA